MARFPRLLPFRYSGVRTLVFSYFSECVMVWYSKVKPLLTDSARMAQWLRLQDLKVLGGSIPTVVTFSLQRGSNPCIFILFKMCNGLI